tara:strand:- start:2786 stop:4975 length:2190 start_codon:yes stop_codon:yes gene_type:complete
MKSFFFSIFCLIILTFVAGVAYLSIYGIETSKLNNLIISEIKKKDSKTEIELEKIKIKLDLKKIQLFLSTSSPKIFYQGTEIPITEIKIYSNINKILKSQIEVSKIIFKIEKFKIQDIQKVSIRIKPSNFKTYLLNNLQGGEIEKALFDLNINKDFKLIAYKASGVVKKVNAKIKNNFTIKDISFNFIADSNLTLINSIKAKYESITIANGSIDLQRKKNIEIKGKFNTKFELKDNQLKKFFTKLQFIKKNKIELQGLLLHEFNLKINDKFKIVDYNYKSNGNISESSIILKDIFTSKLIEEPVRKILLEKTKLEINFNKNNNNSLTLDGLYSTDNSNYKKFKIKNNLNKKNQNYFIDLNLSENLFFDVINFKTKSQKISNIKSEFSVKDNNFTFKSIDFTEGKNFISIKELLLNNKNEIEKLGSINLLTFNKNKINNNFKIIFGKKIFILGDTYDSTYLLKLLSSDIESNLFKNFNGDIDVKLKKLITKSNIPLSNFNLIGSIEKGKFNKISAKSDFSDNEFLDISLKKKPNNIKILEVYSDLPQALLADYKFFEGIIGGKLLYKSVIDIKGSASKLIIENFNVVKAPTFATLLTLADLRGFADLLSGKGMSFDILEIDLKNNSNITSVEEIIALGSSVSLQMDGYVEKKTGLISFGGTLVPAKTLNNIVSKIPVVGNILVGDKVGEGVFGVSFKIKGLPGKIKTTVNPIKTLTPRFITRAFEKMKKK